MSPPHSRSPLPNLSRRGFIALGGIGGAALLTGLPAPAARAEGAQLSLDFERGWLGPDVTASAGASVGRAFARSGDFGCRLRPISGSDEAYLTVDGDRVANDKPVASIIMFFRLVTQPSPNENYMNLFEIGSTSTSNVKSQFTVFFRGGELMCDFNWGEVMRIGGMPSVGEWHMIQAVVNYGSSTYTARVSLDGAPAQTLTSAADKDPQSVRALWLHYPGAAVDHTMDVDDIAMVTSTTDPGFLQPPPTLAVAAGSFSESFEGGLPGVSPTSANTAYDESLDDRGVTNGSVAAAFASDGLRGRCVRFSNTRVSRGTFGFLGKRVGPTKTLYLRRYYKVDRLPQYRTGILLYKFGGNGNGQLGGTHNGSLALGGRSQSNRFTLVDRDSTATLSKAVVPVDEWFRVETKLDFTSGQGLQTVRFFLGANVNGTTPSETLQAALTGPYTDYVEDGIMTNPNVLINVSVDEAANGSWWRGPVA